MLLVEIPYDLTICKVDSLTDIDLKSDFYFIGRTDEEISLVCRTSDVPAHTAGRDDGWRGFRIDGMLDLSLIGILSGIVTLLADAGISIFAVSTFNTDYILVKAEHYEQAVYILDNAGYALKKD